MQGEDLPFPDEVGLDFDLRIGVGLLTAVVSTGAANLDVYVAEGTGRESNRKESALECEVGGNLLEGVGGVR